jgi:crotonobetainyl-CoA:carnitine CoA-transferase CaiB-like acyl-CoA transferase
MPRTRTGTLVENRSGYYARVSTGSRRVTVDLGTKDATTARRKLAAIVDEIDEAKGECDAAR